MLVIIAAGINFRLILKTTSDLHPYEYVYFNELVGGIEGTKRTYHERYLAINERHIVA